LKSQKHEYASQKKWKPLYSPAKLKLHREEMKAKAVEDKKVKVRVCTVVKPVCEGGRWPKGFAPNPLGRPLLGTNRLELLLDAVRRVECKKNKMLLDYFVERAYEDDSVLIAVVRKLNPDLAAIQLSAAVDVMSDETARDIQAKLRERYLLVTSETPPESEVEVEI
jgi:hypothetical protein